MDIYATAQYTLSQSQYPQRNRQHKYKYKSNANTMVPPSRKRRLVDPEKRLRVSKACDRCKRQKTKCDGNSPCAACIKHNCSCTYSQRHDSDSATIDTPANFSVSVPASASSSPPFARSNAVEQEVEEQKQEQKQDKEEKEHYRPIAPTSPTSPTSPASPAFVKVPPPPKATQDSSASDPTAELFLHSENKWRILRNDQNILMEKLANLLFNALSDENKKLVVKPRIQYYGWNSSGSHYIKSNFFFSHDTNYFKSQNWKNILHRDPDLAKYLIDYFLQEVNPLFVILHERIFLQQYRKYLSSVNSRASADNGNSSSSSNVNNDNLFVAILYLVYAISMRFSEFAFNKKYKFGLEEHLFEISFEIISKLSFHWESFELIQGWLLIFLYLRITYKRSSAANALSNAVKMVHGMALDYHITVPKTNLATSYESLKAKRIFWCVYTMDKLFGLHSGSNYALNDRDLQLRYPSSDFALEQDGWLTLPALSMIKLAVLSQDLQFFKISNNKKLEAFDYAAFENKLQHWEGWCKSNGIWDWNQWQQEAQSNDRPKEVPRGFLVISQVKLHYYYIYLTLQMKQLYPLVNKANIFAQNGINKNVQFQNFDKLIANTRQILNIFTKIYQKNLIMTPWYLNLSVLFMVSLAALILTNSGIKLAENSKNYLDAINFLTILRSPIYKRANAALSPVTNKKTSTSSNNNSNSNNNKRLVTVNNVIYEVTYQDKIKMCKEIVWALKVLNKMIILKNQQIIATLSQFIDHGSDDVNQASFSQFGFRNAVANNSGSASSSSSSSSRPVPLVDTRNPTNSSVAPPPSSSRPKLPTLLLHNSRDPTLSYNASTPNNFNNNITINSTSKYINSAPYQRKQQQQQQQQSSQQQEASTLQSPIISPPQAPPQRPVQLAQNTPSSLLSQQPVNGGGGGITVSTNVALPPLPSITSNSSLNSNNSSNTNTNTNIGQNSYSKIVSPNILSPQQQQVSQVQVQQPSSLQGANTTEANTLAPNNNNSRSISSNSMLYDFILNQAANEAATRNNSGAGHHANSISSNNSDNLSDDVFLSYGVRGSIDENNSSVGGMGGSGMYSDLFGNLQWFDQW